MIAPSLMLVSFTEAVDAPGEVRIEPGRYWMGSGDMPGILSMARPGTWQILKTVESHGYRLSPGPTLFIRPGGYGDVLFASGVLAELQKYKIPALLACFPRYGDVLMGVTDTLPYPIPEKLMPEGFHVLLFDSVVQHLRGDIRVEMFRAAGFRWNETMPLMVYKIQPHEETFQKHCFIGIRNAPNVVIHTSASSQMRAWPPQHWRKLFDLLLPEHNVHVIGGPDQVRTPPQKNFYNWTENHGLSFRSSAAMVGVADVFVGVDSCMVHIAEALGTPYVGLYGPIPWRDRSSGDGGKNLDGQAPCAPCYFNPYGQKAWPDGCPGHGTNFCAAMTWITPETVFGQVRELLQRRVKPTG